MRRIFFLIPGLFFCLSGFAAERDFSSAKKSLENLLQNYSASSLVIPLQQDIFLSILKTNLTSEGRLFLKDQKFRLELKGNPSSLSLYDGFFFWHQPDLKEKLVFRIKKPSDIQNLSSFFSADSFFNRFEMTDFVSRQKFRIYQFKPKKEIKGLKKVFMKTNQKWILEMRFIWEELNTWQKYTFSKPVIKENPSSLFEWTQKGYRILEKEDF